MKDIGDLMDGSCRDVNRNERFLEIRIAQSGTSQCGAQVRAKVALTTATAQEALESCRALSYSSSREALH